MWQAMNDKDVRAESSEGRRVDIRYILDGISVNKTQREGIGD